MKDPRHPPASPRDKARQLRCQSTDTERKLWARLRNGQVKRMKFRRQHPIGPYVADFVCVQSRLIVEVDGAGHNTDRQRRCDLMRTTYLENLGYRVLRFWNNEVMNGIDSVVERIGEYL